MHHKPYYSIFHLKHLALILLLSCVFKMLPAQLPLKGDTLKIEGETVEITVPQKKIPFQESPKQAEDIKQVKTDIQNEVNDITREKQKQRIISDNVVVDADIEKAGKDLKVVYSYSLINDTLKYQTDDFGLGKYRVDASNALMVTLEVMKKSIKGQLSKYVTPAKKISITINGSADATPIRGTIPYNGEYGKLITENCRMEAGIEKTSVSEELGINNNYILAFVRGIAVNDYIKSNILDTTYTSLSYYYSATVSSQRGGQYRRVSIEMIVYNAFAEN